MVHHPEVLRHNITKVPYPFGPDTFDRVYMFHCIEHIPEGHHPALITEVRRILKSGGTFALSYPEFTKCALNYINNRGGKRDFWKATIYGRGLTEWDRHKALMDTEEFAILARTLGWKILSAGPEKKETYNTVIVLAKDEPAPTYEDVLRKELAPCT